MKQDRIFKDWIDSFYTHDAEKFASKHCGIMVYNGDGVAGGQRPTGATPGEYIIIGDKRYFVKYPTLGNEYKSFRLVTELFISFLAKKLGINCIDCKLFVDNELQAIGVASPDFGNHITFSQIGLRDYGCGLVSVQWFISVLRDQYPSENDNDMKKLEQELKVRCCFDFLTRQEDRNSYNIAIKPLQKGDKWDVTLAPLYDNALCLNLNRHVYFEIVPTFGKYGESQAELMHTDEYFIKFYDKFKALTYGSNFDKTMEKFESIYGLGKLFECAGKQEEYSKIVNNAKQCLQKQIDYCDTYGNQMN